ncbi:MAG: LPS export ABC transporter periplasmic protein LptC [Paracoccaceae bacterium]
MEADPYSRLIFVLRIALPLIALGILSTLFLVSSRVEPGKTIPFAAQEVAERVKNKRVTRPVFSGLSGNGNEVTFTAEQLITSLNGANEAFDVTGRLDFQSGGHVDLVSNTAEFSAFADNATLIGDVVVTSTDGYILRSQQMMSQLSEATLISPGPVRVDGPKTTLTAQSMRINSQNAGSGLQIRFSGDVKLLYTPKHGD